MQFQVTLYSSQPRIVGELTESHNDEHSFNGFMEHRGLRRIVKAGAVLFLEGAPAEYVFEVLSGTVRCSQAIPGGRLQKEVIMREGDGICLDTHCTYPFTAEAIGNVEVLYCPRVEYETALCDDPGVRDSVVQKLTRKELMWRVQQAA